MNDKCSDWVIQRSRAKEGMYQKDNFRLVLGILILNKIKTQHFILPPFEED